MKLVDSPNGPAVDNDNPVPSGMESGAVATAYGAEFEPRLESVTTGVNPDNDYFIP